MEQYYGNQLREQDDKDFERERREQEEFRNKQKEYFNSLADQVKVTSNRKRFEDMMTNQERQLNQKNIDAYQNMEPVLYSNKVGYKNSPKKQIDLGKITNNEQLLQQRSNGIHKLNIAQAGIGNLIAPEVSPDLNNEKRYVGQAVRQAEEAEKFNLRPVVSNRAYGSDILSRNSNNNLNNKSVDSIYARNGGSSLIGNKSVQRTGASIVNIGIYLARKFHDVICMWK